MTTTTTTTTTASHRNAASIEAITGPMFSGKSATLCRVLRAALFKSQRCLAVVHNHDKERHTDSNHACIRVHDGDVLHATESEHLTIVYASSLENDVGPLLDHAAFHVLAIDEGQFFERLLDNCRRWAARYPLLDRIVVAGLVLTFDPKRPFMGMLRFEGEADSVQRLLATCSACGQHDARFSHRTVQRSERILPGGADAYCALCRTCRMKLGYDYIGPIDTLEAKTRLARKSLSDTIPVLLASSK